MANFENYKVNPNELNSKSIHHKRKKISEWHIIWGKMESKTPLMNLQFLQNL